MKRTPMRSRPRSTGPEHLVVEAALERSSYACEVNGCELRGNRGEGWSMQHRLPRGSGGTRHPGTNRLSNLLVVCGSATTPGGCHNLIEHELREQAKLVGWLLEHCACTRPFDCEHAPRHQPVLILRARWVLLDDAAAYIDVEAPAVEVPNA